MFAKKKERGRKREEKRGEKKLSYISLFFDGEELLPVKIINTGLTCLIETELLNLRDFI